jgi:hypothetical protein
MFMTKKDEDAEGERDYIVHVSSIIRTNPKFRNAVIPKDISLLIAKGYRDGKDPHALAAEIISGGNLEGKKEWSSFEGVRRLGVVMEVALGSNYTNWLNSVYSAVEELMDVSRSDARGIVDADEDLVYDCYQQHLDLKKTAKELDLALKLESRTGVCRLGAMLEAAFTYTGDADKDFSDEHPLIIDMLINTAIEKRQDIAPEDREEAYLVLLKKFTDVYRSNPSWGKKILNGANGRDLLYAFLNHWIDAELKRRGR